MSYFFELEAPLTTEIPPCRFERAQKIRIDYPQGYPHEGIIYSLDWNGEKWVIMVAHNSKVKDGVGLISIEDFEDGGFTARVIESPSSPAHADLIISRVEYALVLGVGYQFWIVNCQHFTSSCYTGVAKSESLQIGVGLGVCVGLLTVLLVQSLKNPRSQGR